MKEGRVVQKKIGVFLLLTFTISSFFYYIMVSTGTASIIGGFWMWSPGIAGILTTIMFREKLRNIGWQIGERIYLLIGFLIPLLYATMIYSVVWISGLGGFKPESPVRILIYISLGLVIACITALGEEIGWRGVLIPELSKSTTFTKASVITGIIWAAWHFPAIIYAEYKSEAPLIFQLSIFTISVIGFSFFTAWLRLKSSSIWPSVIWHGGHNLFIQQIFLSMTTDIGITEYFVDDFGFGVFFSSIILGIVFWSKRADLEKIQG